MDREVAFGPDVEEGEIERALEAARLGQSAGARVSTLLHTCLLWAPVRVHAGHSCDCLWGVQGERRPRPACFPFSVPLLHLWKISERAGTLAAREAESCSYLKMRIVCPALKV